MAEHKERLSLPVEVRLDRGRSINRGSLRVGPALENRILRGFEGRPRRRPQDWSQECRSGPSQGLTRRQAAAHGSGGGLMQDKEKARVGVATPPTSHRQISHIKYTEARETSQRNSAVEPARLRYLRRCPHTLGERCVYEYLREIVAAANAVDRLEAFTRLDPAVVAALGGSCFPRS